MPADSRLKRKLGEQLEWLRSSAAAYDNGRTSEAIRLAGMMRTLFSNSRKSAGLVFQLGGRTIFLNAANQDGAAHLDEELTPEYERLQRPGGINFEFQLQPGESPIFMHDVHLPGLRQTARLRASGQ